MKWWRYIFDERLPKGCRWFPCCLSCPAYCHGRKLHEKEILGAEREEKKQLDVVDETLFINETKIEPMELDLVKPHMTKKSRAS